MTTTLHTHVSDALYKIGAQQHIDTLPPEYNYEELVELLTRDQKDNFTWLRSFLKRSIDDSACQFLLQKLKELVQQKDATCQPWESLRRFFDRAEQLRKIKADTFEKETPSLSKLLEAALYIEATLDKTKKVYVSADVSGLLWGLQSDARAVFLLARHEFSVFKASGKFKTIALAAKLRTPDVPRQPSLYVHTMMARTEAAAAIFLQGPSIAKIITSTEAEEQVSCIFKRYDIDAVDHLMKKSLNGEERFILADRALSGLTHIHAKGCIHGDVKLDNILLNLGKDKKVCDVALTDFGFVSARIGALSSGTGTYESLSPEALGIVPFGGDAQKCDVWALGCALYAAEFNHFVVWGNLNYKFFQKDAPRPVLQEHFFKRVQAIQNELLRTPGKIEEMGLRHLIAKMLQVDPMKRISAASAKKELMALQDESHWAVLKRTVRVFSSMALSWCRTG